jgi:nucleotide-binding universal stress UspA family protein
MYDRVLVSLDGSDLAEAILPFAEQLAGPLDAELILLRVVEPVSTAEALASGGYVSPESFTLRDLEAKRYLAGVKARLSKKGLRTRALTVLGAPAEEILAVVKHTGANLVAMTTHGRSGLGRALFGSVAERVLRESPVPVLLMRMPLKAEPSAAAPRSS